MAPLGVVGELYIISAAVGTIYLLAGVVMGQLHGHADAGVGHADAGMGHQDAGVGHADVGAGHGHGSLADSGGDLVSTDGDAITHGHVDALQPGFAGGHGDAAADTHAPGHGLIAPPPDHGVHDAGGAVQVVERPGVRPGRLILTLLSPMTIATFLAFFGISGLILGELMPFLGALTMAPALLLAVIITSQVLRLLRLAMAKLKVSTIATTDEIVGQTGEVLASIGGQYPGEITYVVGSKRLSGPARPAKSGGEFPRGSRVIITDYRDGVAYVDHFEDFLLEDTASDVIEFKNKVTEE